jgi:hypothetical protein
LRVTYLYLTYLDELSSKIYRILDNLQNKLIKTPTDIKTNFEIFKNLFLNFLPKKDKNLFDFSVNWLLNLYFKLEENDEPILHLFFQTVSKRDMKIENRKSFNLEDNYFYKIIKQKSDNQEILQKIFFIHECLEKKSSQNIEKTKDFLNKIKLKNQKISEFLIKFFGKNVLDFHIINIGHKIKLNKSDFENDKSNFKSDQKFYSEIYSYFYDLFLICFNNQFHMNHRKLILFIILILIKSIGIRFLNKFFEFLRTQKLINHVEFTKSLHYMDFSIFSEPGNYTYGSIDTSIGYLPCLLNFISELLGTTSIKSEDKTNLEQNETKVLDKLSCLISLVKLFEYFITSFFDIHIKEEKIIFNVYNFYCAFQEKMIQNYIVYIDNIKKRFYESQAGAGNFQQILPKFNKKYKELGNVISELVSNFNSRNGNGCSLIFTNWLFFLYKNTTIFDCYKAVRIYLVTPKENNQFFSLLKLNDSINKFYPSLWKIVLNSFLNNDQANELNEEKNLHFLKNLKFMFYYETPNDIQAQQKKEFISTFYDSISYNSQTLLKYFKEKFAMLINVFNSDERQVFKGGDRKEMDICFETYIQTYHKESTSNTKINKNQKEVNSIHLKISMEILKILSFLLQTYEEKQIINNEIIEFTVELIDKYIDDYEINNNEKKDYRILSEYVKNVLVNIQKSYKKSCDVSEIYSAPSKILYFSLIKNLLMKILYNSPKSKICYELFSQLFQNLNVQGREKAYIIDIIISCVKQMVYKNVDNQSFKNPVVL